MKDPLPPELRLVRDKPAPKRSPFSPVGPWFTAKYSGTCGNCDDEIIEGEQARYVDNVINCQPCGEAAEDD
jgi:hypothetical protein